MKSTKYKFSPDSKADCVAQHYLLELYFLRVFFRILIGSTQFTTLFQFATPFLGLSLQTVLSEKWNFLRL